MEWTHVTFVESDQKVGVEYEIQRRGDGAMRCSCEAFRFIRAPLGSSSKQCKHMKAHQLRPKFSVHPIHEQHNRVTLPKKAKTTASIGQVETFTFRRAIRFEQKEAR